ncbi:MAG TPA: lipopolysaccharide heptosyltransferase II [bacterium]|jgi:lipopolysaccharide heptosyltransferase II
MSEKWSNILIVDIAFIGDLLMSTPAIECLRKHFPDSKIDILVAPQCVDVIEDNSDINDVLVTRMKSGGLDAILEESARIKDRKYDSVICFHRGHGTLFMLFKSGIKNRIGFTHGGRGFFLTGGVPFQILKHRTWNHLHLLEQGAGIPVDYSFPAKMVVIDEAIASVRDKLNGTDSDKGIYAVNPNAAWKTKRWHPERFAELINKIGNSGIQPVLVGANSDIDTVKLVESMVNFPLLNLTGQTSLKELAALFSICRFVVTNDSGPMHIAQAVGSKVISIFGPTDPRRCGPWMSENSPIQAEIDCIRCYRKSCWHMSCMKKIATDQVLDAARSLQD